MNPFLADLENYFTQFSSSLMSELRSTEELSLSLLAEQTDFVRFNQSKIRQTTNVHQKSISMNFQNRQRKISLEGTICGDIDSDILFFRELITRARDEIEVLPEDPFAAPMENRGNSHKHHIGETPELKKVISDILSASTDKDFVGIYTAGPSARAAQNSKGQKHWFSTENFYIDFSLFTQNIDHENKAVKGIYADTKWHTEKFKDNLSSSINQLSLLQRKTVPVPPGSYKVYLGPGAMAEICGMLSWNALSYDSYRKGACAFSKLVDKQISLSPQFSLQENFDLGLAPRFNALGEMAPEKLILIENGQIKNMLVSARASKEYGVISNGAYLTEFGNESLRSPEILPGKLKQENILKELGQGLYLSNLHYLNWSDVMQARITGMTRYACFWVENGEIVGPIKDMRFDVSLFDLLGKNLIDITEEQYIDPAVGTYMARELGGKKIPGILAENFELTL